jgi:lipopolysaccharide export system permease protein
LSRFETYRVLVGERPLTTQDSLPPRARNTIDLIITPNPKFQGELTWRIGLVLGGANLLLLGVGLSATNPRRAGSWNLLFALLAFTVYFNLINLSQTWVGNGRVGMGAALVAVHGGMFVFALVLLWWRDHGSVRGLWPRARWAASA